MKNPHIEQVLKYIAEHKERGECPYHSAAASRNTLVAARWLMEQRESVIRRLSIMDADESMTGVWKEQSVLATINRLIALWFVAAGAPTEVWTEAQELTPSQYNRLQACCTGSVELSVLLHRLVDPEDGLLTRSFYHLDNALLLAHDIPSAIDMNVNRYSHATWAGKHRLLVHFRDYLEHIDPSSATAVGEAAARKETSR